MKHIVALVFGLLIQSAAHGAVWTATNAWDANWENAYREWISENAKTNFFSRKTEADGSPNPFYGLKPDCADVVYTFRVVFAWKHKLPVAFKDPTGGSLPFTQNMSAWDSIADESLRVRRFLTRIYGIMGTRSIPNDTYPVAVNKANIGAGTVILTVASNHHSWTIAKLDQLGLPYLVFSSTTNKGLDLYDRNSWPYASYIYKFEHNPATHAGFRYWRPAEYINQPVTTVPGYSEEQYQVKLGGWQKFVVDRLKQIDETPTQKLTRILKEQCKSLEERVGAVQEATDFMKTNGGKCFTEDQFFTYSTPSRDERFMMGLLDLRNTFIDWRNSTEYSPANPLERQLLKVYQNINSTPKEESAAAVQPVAIDQDSLCPVGFGTQGARIDLAEFKRRLFRGMISNNPIDALEVRWGERARAAGELANKCTRFEHWEPSFDGPGH